MKLYLCHSSAEKFDKFDVSKFRENCLDNDTQEFGVFFYAANDKNYINSVKCNNRRFAKRDGATAGYQYMCEVEVDPKTLIDPDAKISFEEAQKMMQSFNSGISKECYGTFKNNRRFFYAVCKHLYKHLSQDWSKVAQALIKAGYSGYNDMHEDSEGFVFGTIVLFDTKNIRITSIEQF